MEMFSAKACELTFLSRLEKIKIPFFQRRYVWNEENWEELYNNFFGQNNLGFLGSIILKQEENLLLDSNECLVIDGQQRLTTLSILIMALYDSLEDFEKQRFETDLKAILFNTVPGFDTEKNERCLLYLPKLIHSNIDKEEYDFIIDLNNSEKIKSNNVHNRINRCYQWFYERFVNKKYNEKIKKCDTIIDSNLDKNIFYEKKVKVLEKLITSRAVKILVVIEIRPDVDEQKVFDTLNTAGVRLTVADTIKNYLFDKLIKIYRNNYQLENVSNEKLNSLIIKKYNKTWNKTFCETNELDNLWNKEFVTGRIKRTEIDMFLHSFALIKNIYDTDNQSLNELPSSFKKYIDNFNSKQEIDSFIIEMCEYANQYRKIFIDSIQNTEYRYSQMNVLPRILFFCNKTSTKALNPYILYITYKYKDDEISRNRELHKIEKVLIYTFLEKNLTRSKNYNKLCSDFIKNEKRIEEEIMTFGNMDNGLNLLLDIKNSDAKILLFLIELYRRKDEENDFVKIEYSDSFQLEHILPEKWEQYWTSLPKKDYFGNILESEDDKIAYRNKMVKMLGNMTILKGKLNNRISNADILTKIEGKKEIEDTRSQKGIRDYSDFKITKDDVIAYYDKNHNWTEERIYKRTKELYRELKEAILY